MPQTTGTGIASMRSSMASTGLIAVDHLGLGLELLELAHIGADDESLVLARQNDEAADRTVSGARFDTFDNRHQLLERTATERVLAFTLAVEDRPGDALLVDGEAPVLQGCDIGHEYLSLRTLIARSDSYRGGAITRAAARGLRHYGPAVM